MKKVVFDTNVSIGAFFWNGNPRKVYEFARQGKIKLFYSKDILEELIRVLAYKKFGLTNQEILPIINDFIAIANFTEVSSKIKPLPQDPTDTIFLECAVDAKAHYIISGDHHLLELKHYKGITIVTPKEFIAKKLS